MLRTEAALNGRCPERPERAALAARRSGRFRRSARAAPPRVLFLYVFVCGLARTASHSGCAASRLTVGLNIDLLCTRV